MSWRHWCHWARKARSPEAYRYLSFTDVKRAIQVASADGLARPWRMPLYPWPIVIALIANLALLAAFVYDDPFNSLLGLAIVAGFALVALALRRRPALPVLGGARSGVVNDLRMGKRWVK